MALTYPYRMRGGEPSEGVDGMQYRRNIAQFPGAPLAPNRNLGLAMVLVNAAYTISDVDQVVFVDATAGAVVVSLPGFLSYRQGAWFRIVKVDSSGNAVTVQRLTATSDTVNGGTALADVTTQWQGWDVYSLLDSSSTGDGSGHGLYYATAVG